MLNGGHSRISGTASQVARHGRFHVEWWALPDLQHRLRGGPPSMFSRWMVGAPESSALTPKGPAINVLALNGGRY
jgi:hypothetical protein